MVTILGMATIPMTNHHPNDGGHPGDHFGKGDLPRDGDHPKNGEHPREGDHPRDCGCLRNFYHPKGWLLDFGSRHS